MVDSSCFFLILVLPLVTHAAFQHIIVSSSPSMDPVATVNIAIGCIPATFSNIPSSFPPNNSKAVLAQPEDACYPEGYSDDPRLWALDNSADINGNIALVRRCKTCNCYFDEKAFAAVNSGATGVIIINDNEEGVLPITAGSLHGEDSTVPVCMVTHDDGNRILQVLASSTDAYISFENVFPEDLGITPSNDINYLTYVDVLTPWDIKWRYPASNCLWNPTHQTSLSMDPITAKVVKAELVMHCPFVYDDNHLYNCQQRGCHVTGVSNAAELQGNIALFLQYDDDELCHDVQELAAAAQIAGAVAAIASSLSYWSLPLFDAPKWSPFDFTIQTYVVPGRYAADWYTFIGLGEEVVLRLPPFEGELPETYFPHVSVMGSLPETTVCAKESNRDKECFHAGQATFNPATSPPVEAQLIVAQVDASCHDAENLDGKDGSGLDCAACANQLQQDNAITNKNNLDGKIALVRATETFCINEWEDLIDNLEAHGVVGVLVGNVNDYTYTMVDTEEDEITNVPVFNVAIDSMERILELYALPGTVEVSFPPIKIGEVVPKNVTSHHLAAQELGLTQVEITRPSRLAGKIEAGQANFNKEFDGGLFNLDRIVFYEFCDGQISCHKCNLLANPLIEVYNYGGVALLDARSASCFNPIGSIVRIIQEAGAEAVVVVNDGEELLTLSNGGADIDEDLTIPVFNIGREAGKPLLSNLNTPVTIRLPKIKKEIVDEGNNVGGHDDRDKGEGESDGEGDTYPDPEDGDDSSYDSDGNPDGDDKDEEGVEWVYIAPETLDPESIEHDEDVETDQGRKQRSSSGGPQFGSGSQLGGVVWTSAILSLVLAFIAARQINKYRNRQRMLGVYNQLNAGTQITNPISGADGSDAEDPRVGLTASAVREPEVIITARPWKSDMDQKKGDASGGIFGLLDFRSMSQKAGGTFVELEMSSTRSVGMASASSQGPIVEASYAQSGPVVVGRGMGEGKSCDTDSDDDQSKPPARNTEQRRASAAPLLESVEL